MRKINKDFTDIPESLKPTTTSFFPKGIYPEESSATHSKRMSIINTSNYPSNNSATDKRYKTDDIIQKLNDIYHKKCAFCEQRVEQTHVEHYRPKKGYIHKNGQQHNGYYWLSFSWDNLLIACPNCNSKKGTHFDILGTRATFVNNEFNITNINSLSSTYDLLELPLMINPEKEDPESHISFDKSGNIFSVDRRYIYTIEKCNLKRNYLCDYRREILKDFESKVRSRFVEYIDNKKRLYESIEELIRDFVSDANNLNKEYISFRKYAIKNGWLNDIVKSLNK